jgi:RHS repeat-associated protein
VNHFNHINQCSDIFVYSDTPVVYAIFRDNLGTITHLKSSSETLEYSFDAFGRRRSADDWSYTLDANDKALFADRGFTGHEHLTQFGLINMNGRLYDPLVGRFLSPDNYVQSPDFTQNFNRYGYCLNNPLRYTDPSGDIVWFVPVIYFAVYAGIEYGTQVYHNYQASKLMVELGYDPMSNKEKWVSRIDWFDVALNGAGGAVSAFVPSAAPWIMYGTPLVTNAFNWYGDGTKQSIFNGSIPINQYLINTTIDEMSLYVTNVIKTGLATPSKDIWSPKNHTKYFSKEILGKQITGRSIEDMIQQGVASWMDYSVKASMYPDFNPDRLCKDGIIVPQTPNMLNSPLKSLYDPELLRNRKIQSKDEGLYNFGINLQLRRSPIR